MEVNLPDTTVWVDYLWSNKTFLNKLKTLRGELNFSYTTAQYDLLYRKRYQAALALALKLSLLKNRVQVGLITQDVLRTDKNYSAAYTNNIKQVYINYNDNRFLRISVSYKFGNNKINVEKKEFGNEDEKRRTN